jgi:hypothetical protein
MPPLGDEIIHESMSLRRHLNRVHFDIDLELPANPAENGRQVVHVDNHLVLVVGFFSRSFLVRFQIVKSIQSA